MPRDEEDRNILASVVQEIYLVYLIEPVCSIARVKCVARNETISSVCGEVAVADADPEHNHHRV